MELQLEKCGFNEMTQNELENVEGGGFWAAVGAGAVKAATFVGTACGVGAVGGAVIIGAAVAAVGVGVYIGVTRG